MRWPRRTLPRPCSVIGQVSLVGSCVEISNGVAYVEGIDGVVRVLDMKKHTLKFTDRKVESDVIENLVNVKRVGNRLKKFVKALSGRPKKK